MKILKTFSLTHEGKGYSFSPDSKKPPTTEMIEEFNLVKKGLVEVSKPKKD